MVDVWIRGGIYEYESRASIYLLSNITFKGEGEIKKLFQQVFIEDELREIWIVKMNSEWLVISLRNQR